MNLDKFFNAQSVAVIGAAREDGKIGNVIFKNFLRPEFRGRVFPVNPNVDEILGKKSYPSIKDIPEKVELAVIAVPAAIVPKVIDDCGKKGVKHVIIISAGFKEIGNTKLDIELEKAMKKYGIKAIGPNCLGIYDSESRIDTLFLPQDRLRRPKRGGISFVSQSGASGSAILDLAAKDGFGFAKFISYGNAMNVDESDLIEYLGNDPKTRVICLYVEGIRDGKKFLDICKKVSEVKPIIAIKGGITEAGKKAALSHTGALAGSAEIYFGAFKQAGIIRAETLEEMFDIVNIFEKAMTKPKGKRIQVITNGGGFGILCADAISTLGLGMAKLSAAAKKELKKTFPPIAVIDNPMDLLGDATTERYRLAIDACMKDKGIDLLLIIVLTQTPLIEKEKIVSILSDYNNQHKKPIVVIITGSEYSEKVKQEIEEKGIPCFRFPFCAVKAIKKLIDFYC